jgi:hypothetical protein
MRFSPLQFREDFKILAGIEFYVIIHVKNMFEAEDVDLIFSAWN